jgi:hypothetical protein
MPKLTVGLAALTLLAESVEVALTLCVPSAIGVTGSQFHAPLALAVAVQITFAFSITFTVLFGSAVPLNSGVVSLVVLPAVGDVITGAVGAAVSTFTSSVVAGPVLPAGSVWVTLSV